MNSVFVSHKFTGLTHEEMDAHLFPVKSYFESKGLDVFISLYLEEQFQKDGRNSDQIYLRCCEQQACYDATLGVIWSQQDSYGMELEFKKTIELGRPYHLLIKSSVVNQPWISKYKEQAQSCIVFDDHTTLNEILSHHF